MRRTDKLTFVQWLSCSDMEITRGSRILSTYCNCKNEELLYLIKGRKKSIFALSHRKYIIK